MSASDARPRIVLARGGRWFEDAARAVADRGGRAICADIIDVTPPRDPGALAAAVDALGAGRYWWLMATSATTAAVLADAGARVPSTTRIAAVGAATRLALEEEGFAVAFSPERDARAAIRAHGASAGQHLAATWATRHGEAPQRVLALQSEEATADLATSLARAGHHVEVVAAYGVAVRPLPGELAEAIRVGEVDAVFLTSGMVARAVAEAVESPAGEVLVVAIGPGTAHEARLRGLRVDGVARDTTLAAMLDLVPDFAR